MSKVEEDGDCNDYRECGSRPLIWLICSNDDDYNDDDADVLVM